MFAKALFLFGRLLSVTAIFLHHNITLSTARRIAIISLMEKVIIIAGLGNPGKEYQATRHNIGFRAVEQFAKENSFSEFSFSKKYNSLVSETAFNNQKVIVCQPQTFMNNSGTAIAKLVKQYKTENLIIVHDDIDLPLGIIRIAKNRGSAGHNGVESIIEKINSEDFIRVRVGINNKSQTNRPVKSEAFVLKKFTKEEEKIIEEILDRTSAVIRSALQEGLEKTMNRFNAN